MKTLRTGIRLPVLRGWSVVALLLVVAGCEIDSGDVARAVGINVAGRYADPNGGRLVARSSGAAVTWLELQQRGDRLQGVDNNGVGYWGRLHQVEGRMGRYRLEGVTTAGAPFEMTGTLEVSGDTATLRGIWIESDRQGGVYGRATVTPPPDPEPPAPQPELRN